MTELDRRPETPGEFLLQPVGVARATGDPEVMVIQVHEQFADALLGIEQQTHLLVLYWMHALRPEVRNLLQSHPRGDTTRPLRGVFALHSPMRPNPIGVTRVELMGVEGTRIHVRGLDAFDGSPIIDIKSG